MTYLTDKARRFVDYAINRFGSHEQQSAWYGWVLTRPEFAEFSVEKPELPKEISRIVVAALRELAKNLDQEIEAGLKDEDIMSDMGNDLSFIEAVAGDIERDITDQRAYV